MGEDDEKRRWSRFAVVEGNPEVDGKGYEKLSCGKCGGLTLISAWVGLLIDERENVDFDMAHKVLICATCMSQGKVVVALSEAGGGEFKNA